MNKCPECFSLGKHASFCSRRETVVEPKPAPKVVCLCGSTRSQKIKFIVRVSKDNFVKQWNEANPVLEEKETAQ